MLSFFKIIFILFIFIKLYLLYTPTFIIEPFVIANTEKCPLIILSPKSIASPLLCSSIDGEDAVNYPSLSIVSDNEYIVSVTNGVLTAEKEGTAKYVNFKLEFE